MNVNGLYLLVGGFKPWNFIFHFIKKGCHPEPIDFHSIIFQDGEIAPPTSLGFLMRYNRYNPVSNHESLIFFRPSKSAGRSHGVLVTEILGRSRLLATFFFFFWGSQMESRKAMMGFLWIG